ncbi:conjugative transposon membrane protein [Streptococcus suis]|uniref:PrgI family protein n=1 Tax=Streptococcus suis TaxID=1307 RepID=UPI0005CE7626|nr:PrgI family protein [Streptococcus suis]NQI25776.1 PrgI family protein [Streptococcus suis]CYT92207.1 conjugative transposon membrane protein [Streptococcus suis]
MTYVQIPKDLSKVKTKIAFNLTKRQLIGFSVAGLASLPVYLSIRESVGNDLAMLVFIVLAFPFLFLTFYEKDGLTSEIYLKYIFLQQHYQPCVRYKRTLYKKMHKEEVHETRKKKKTGTRVS